MLQSHAFIDPKIASKIHSFESELKSLSIQKQQILLNGDILHSSKAKLLRYNQECERNTNRLLDKQKEAMVEYLDEQMAVVSKQEGSTEEHGISADLTWKLPLKENYVDKSANLNATKCQDSVEGHRILESMTTRTTRTKVQRRQPKPNNKVSQKQSGGSVNKLQNKRLKQKIHKQSQIINGLIDWIQFHQRESQTSQVPQSITSDDQQIRELLQEKNQKLTEKCKHLTQQIHQLRTTYQQKASNISHTYEKIKMVRQENQMLTMQRNLKLKQKCKK